jgi:hypothetical protein
MKRYLHVTGEGATPNSNRIPDGTASEIVILTCLTLHFSRTQISWTVVTRPETLPRGEANPHSPPLGGKKHVGLGRPMFGVLGWRCSYSGLSPSASNCRLHSVGGSRSRSTPMPRGRRPSTAALTSLGARKASEIVILTCRTLHFSRTQISWTVVTRPETTSSSHSRPLAMAHTRRARRSNCSGWTSLRDALWGSRIRRDLLDGGFCQGIVSDRSSERAGSSSV